MFYWLWKKKVLTKKKPTWHFRIRPHCVWIWKKNTALFFFYLIFNDKIVFFELNFIYLFKLNWIKRWFFVWCFIISRKKKSKDGRLIFFSFASSAIDIFLLSLFMRDKKKYVGKKIYLKGFFFFNYKWK